MGICMYLEVTARLEGRARLGGTSGDFLESGGGMDDLEGVLRCRDGGVDG